jgi:hypothetical protein
MSTAGSLPPAGAGEGVQTLPASLPPDEVDVWWGSYAGRTMLPSFAVCLLATGLIAWLVWIFVPSGYVKPAFLGLGGAVWLVQGIRWALRFFGLNYRMTSCRLFHHWGFLDSARKQVELADVAQVLVKSSGWEKRLGVGQIILVLEKAPQTPVILKGVRQPARVAEEVRLWVKHAREARAGAGGE